jgi:predicted RND superfamily exporter protein
MKHFKSMNAAAVAGVLSRYPGRAFALGLLLTAVMAAGMSRLYLETDYEVFFAPEAPEIQRFREFQAQFGREDTLFFAVSAPEGGSLTDERSLMAIDAFTRQARAIPYVRRVASIANYPLVDAQNDEINIAPAYYVEDGRVITDRTPAEIENRLLEESTVKHKLMSDDGNTAGILATLALDQERRAQSAKEAWTATQSLLAQMRNRYPEYRFRVTGSTALDAAFEQANEHDLSVLFPAAVTVMVLLAALLFRSLMFYVALSLVIGAATVSCLGFAGWAGIPLSSVSITSPVIVIILAIAELMHLFVATRQQHEGERRQRNRAAINKVLVPALLTTATTMAGLLMLNFSATPPFKHLGNIAAVGVLMAFVSTFLLGAPLLRWVKSKPGAQPGMDRVMGALAAFVVAPGGRVCAVIVGVSMLALSGGVFLNNIDDNYVEYFGERFEFRRDSDFIDSKLSGIHSLEYSLRARQGEVFSQPYLQAVRDFSDWAMAQPGVRGVDSIENTVAQVHRAFNNNNDAYRHAPDDDDLIQQYSMLYEMSVPTDFDFRNRVSGAGDTSRVTLYLSNLSISEIAALDERAGRWLHRHSYFDHRPAEAYNATGTSILFSRIGLNNIHSMLFGTGLLFLTASVLMWLIFRVPAVAAGATLANILPALATLGLWGLLVGRLGMGSAAVVAVTLGIVIDDTIHLGHRYLSLKRRGISTHDAVQKAMVEVGPALLVTTLILAVGFLMIAMSAFQINASMGLVVASTVVMALVFDLLVLPVVLLQFDTEKQTVQEETPYVQQVQTV